MTVLAFLLGCWVGCVLTIVAFALMRTLDSWRDDRRVWWEDENNEDDREL